MLAGALLLCFTPTTLAADAAAALPVTGDAAVAWWVWPLGLFVVCFLLGIVAVPAGVESIVMKMLARVPALVADVDPTAKSYSSVKKRDFFMMGCAQRMTIVEDEMDLAMDVLPNSSLHLFSLESVKICVVPHEEIDFELGLGLAEPEDLFLESFRLRGTAGPSWLRHRDACPGGYRRRLRREANHG